MDTLDITRMDKNQRLQAMEAIWDSLVHETEELESPNWHRSVLEERKNSIEQGRAEFVSIDELRARLKR